MAAKGGAPSESRSTRVWVEVKFELEGVTDLMQSRGRMGSDVYLQPSLPARGTVCGRGRVVW